MPTFPIPVNLTVANNNNPVNVTVSEGSVSVNLGIETQIVAGSLDEYEGPYSVTPTEEAQTLQTKNFRMTDNIVVNPIPSNYGLITWNGSIITVS